MRFTGSTRSQGFLPVPPRDLKLQPLDLASCWTKCVLIVRPEADRAGVELSVDPGMWPG